MSKAEFEQEYLASFNVFEGQIYNFNREASICEYQHQDGCEYIAGCDPGYRDATAFVVISYNPNSDQFHIVDEYLKSEATTDKHAQAFREYLDRWQVEVVFIDSAAAQFAGDLAYTYNISTTKAKKDILPGIAYVQTLIETNRLKVAPHCQNVLDVMDQYRWDKRETLTREKPVHDKYSHMADALRYALYTYTL
jgi:phage terminase large subunit